eukprot:1247610-Prymnesium_polylepis.1
MPMPPSPLSATANPFVPKTSADASLSAEAKVFVPGDPVTATLPEDNNKVFATPVSAKTTLQTPKRTPNSRQKKGSSRRDSQECAREDETIGV